jgi:hypothetical protein
MLDFLESSQPLFDRELVEEKLGWVRDFRVQLQDWSELFEMMTTAESFIRHHGLYPGVRLTLEKHVLPLPAQTERTQRLRCELIAFVTEQEAQVRPGERLLGSSEIIESVFGKMKRLEQDQSKNRFTTLLLGLGALVSTTTSAVIQKALETVPTKQVEIWRQQTLGQTLQSKRREAFATSKNAEQK